VYSRFVTRGMGLAGVGQIEVLEVKETVGVIGCVQDMRSPFHRTAVFAADEEERGEQQYGIAWKLPSTQRRGTGL